MDNSSPNYSLLTPGELANLPDLVWLVDGILPKPCLAVLYGDPGCGKTFVALSLALSVAAGTTWLHRPAEATSVLYIAAEGVLGLRARVAAHQALFGPVDDTIRFLPDAPNVLDPDGLDALTNALDAASFCPGLIIVDTLSRVAVGADENSSRDMGLIVEALDSLKEAYGASVLVLHHKTKSGHSERGSSVVRGAADVMIKCSAKEHSEGQEIYLICDKMKEDGPFDPVAVIATVIKLPDGRSSLVVSREAESRVISGNFSGDTILGILQDSFGQKGATNKELLTAYEESGFGKKSSFDRALRVLKQKNLLRVEGDGRGKRYFPKSVSVSSVSD